MKKNITLITEDNINFYSSQYDNFNNSCKHYLSKKVTEKRETKKYNGYILLNLDV